MMKLKFGQFLFVLAAIIAVGTALMHLSCIYFGPQCYATQMAPQIFVESAKNGTLLAPIGAISISSLFILLGFYAVSGAGLIRPLPWLKFALYSIAIVCIIRGFLGIQLWVRHPENFSDFALYATFVWLIAGLLYLGGTIISSSFRESF